MNGLVAVQMGDLISTRTLDEGYVELRGFMINGGSHIGHVAMLPNVEPPTIRISTVIPGTHEDLPMTVDVGLSIVRSVRNTSEFVTRHFITCITEPL